MYLPTFYKIRHEWYARQLMRYGTFAIPAALYGTWCLWPSIINMVYTDIFPPPDGVERRAVEE